MDISGCMPPAAPPPVQRTTTLVATCIRTLAVSLIPSIGIAKTARCCGEEDMAAVCSLGETRVQMLPCLALLPSELKLGLLTMLAGFGSLDVAVLRTLLVHDEAACAVSSLQFGGCVLLHGKDIAACLLPGPWPCLRTLNLRHLHTLRDEHLATIAMTCPSLTSLDVSGCVLLTSAGLHSMAAATDGVGLPSGHGPPLRRLAMGGCWQVSDAAPLLRLTTLRSLEVSGCWQLAGVASGAPSAGPGIATPPLRGYPLASAFWRLPALEHMDVSGVSRLDPNLLLLSSAAVSLQAPIPVDARTPQQPGTGRPLPDATTLGTATDAAVPEAATAMAAAAHDPAAAAPPSSHLGMPPLYVRLTSLDVRDTAFSGQALVLLALAAPQLAHLYVSGGSGLQGRDVGRFLALRAAVMAAGNSSRALGSRGGGSDDAFTQGQALSAARTSYRVDGALPRAMPLVTLSATNLAWDEWDDDAGGDGGSGWFVEGAGGQHAAEAALAVLLAPYIRGVEVGSIPWLGAGGSEADAPTGAAPRRLFQFVDEQSFSSVNCLFEAPMVQALASLTSMDLSGSRANDMTLALLAQHLGGHLRSLALARSPDVSDEGLEHLVACTHLTRLDVSHCSGSSASRAPGAGFKRRPGEAHQQQAASSRSPALWGARAPPLGATGAAAGFQQMSKRSKLLHMGGVSDAGMAGLLAALCRPQATPGGARASSRRYAASGPRADNGSSGWPLSAPMTAIAGGTGTHPGAEAEGLCSGLRDLRVACTGVGDATLASCSGLTSLDLTGCKRITDTGVLQALMLSPELKKLRLGGTPCSAEGLACPQPGSSGGALLHPGWGSGPGTALESSSSGNAVGTSHLAACRPSRFQGLQRVALPRAASAPTMLAWLASGALHMDAGRAITGLIKLDLQLPTNSSVAHAAAKAGRPGDIAPLQHSSSSAGGSAGGVAAQVVGRHACPELAMLLQLCPCLRSLHLRGLGAATCVTDALAALMATSCPLISQLSLQGAVSLTDDGLQDLVSRLPGLRSLDVSGCTSLTGQAFLRLLHLGCCTAAQRREAAAEGLVGESLAFAGLDAVAHEVICVLNMLAFTTSSAGQTTAGRPLAADVSRAQQRVKDSWVLQGGDGCSQPSTVLQTLCLDGCTKMTEVGLAALMLTSPHLQSLQLDAVQGVTPRLLAWAALVLDNLPSLGVGSCPQLRGLQDLPFFPNLSSIDRH